MKLEAGSTVLGAGVEVATEGGGEF